MNKEKFKSKSIELCQSALNFSKEFEEAETLINEINAPENQNDVEIKNSKLRKLKDTFSKMAQYCEDAYAESKELDRIPGSDEESIKRKTKVQSKNFSELNKKVKSMNESLQGIEALKSIGSNSKINFSEVFSNKLVSFSQEFGELKEVASDSVDSVEEVAEKVNEMIQKDKENKESPKIGNDSKPSSENKEETVRKLNNEEDNMDKKAMTEQIDETISQAEEKVNQLTDETKKAEFTEKIDEIKEMKMDTAEDIENKLTHLEKFSAEFAEAANDAQEAACEKCGETPCQCNKIAKQDEQINETIDEISKAPEAANFARKLRMIRNMRCFSEDDLNNKLEATEEVAEEIKGSSDESNEVAKKDEQINETIDEISKAPEAANFARKLRMIRNMRCFSEEDVNKKLEATEEVAEEIKGSSTESDEVAKKDEKINEAIDKMIEEPKAANFARVLRSIKLIKCFSEKDVEEKLSAAEEVKENIDKKSSDEKSTTEQPKADVQKLAECVDKMESIISSMNPSEEVKKQFSRVDRAIQNFCGNPTKGSKEAIDSSVEELKDTVHNELNSYSACRSFSRLNKCFAEIVDTISSSDLPDSTIDGLTPSTEIGKTDVKSSVDEVKKQDEQINDLLVDAEKTVAKIKDPTVKNFASKRIRLISKMSCFSDEDINKKLEATEELGEDVKKAIEAERDETIEKKPESEAPKTEPDPASSISDKEATNFSANNSNAPAWKSVYR